MRHTLLSTVSILACALAGQAMAQSTKAVDRAVEAAAAAATDAARGTPSGPRAAATTIRVGQTITGTIGPEDPKLSMDNSSYELYRVQVPAGHRVTATLSSSAFQPVIGLGETITDECDGCAVNVGEMSTKAAVASRVVTSAGPMEIRVNTMNAGEVGAFTLNVTSAVPPPLTAQAITFGQSRTGTLTSTDATAGDENTITDAYALRLAAGQQVQIDLSSSAFDAKLELYGPNGAKISDDDDSGPGTSARIRHTATRAGVYQIRAMSLSEGGTGAYTLRAGARPAVVPMPAPRPLVLGTATTGAIAANTPTYENEGEETKAVRYSFNATAGQVYRITATKRDGSELDPKIAVGKLVNGVLNEPAIDDDGAGDLNASLRFRPTASGVHVVEVTSAGDSMGAYDVKVVQSPPDRQPGPPRVVTLGTEYTGNLADGGPRRSDDTLFEGYSIALKRGDQVTIHMKKVGETGNLDPKVEIGKGTVSAFEQIAEDDDGGAELNSRLRFVAPDDGNYIIRATTLGGANEGPYTLKVETTPPPVIPPEPTAIQLGVQARGTLATTDPLFNDQNYYDRYLLDAKVGDTYEITVEAPDFDVIVGARSRLREDDDYVTDDDGAGGTNAKLTYTVTTAGPQVIRVTSLGEEDVGSYTITVVKK